MDLETLEKSYHFHHSALRRGYQSVRYPQIIREYHGRFGDGYTVEYPNLRRSFYTKYSNTYHVIDYYVK